MQFHDYKRLIEKYSVDFTARTPSNGDWDDTGKYVCTMHEENLRGAILSHRLSKVYKSGGALTQQDRALYMLSPLDKSLEGAEILFEGNRYTIGSLLENSRFTGVYSYDLKFVSVFNEVSENG